MVTVKRIQELSMLEASLRKRNSNKRFWTLITEHKRSQFHAEKLFEFHLIANVMYEVFKCPDENCRWFLLANKRYVKTLEEII